MSQRDVESLAKRTTQRFDELVNLTRDRNTEVIVLGMSLIADLLCLIIVAMYETRK